MGALAVLETRLLPVEPGSQASAQVRVRNTGSVVDQFTFQILGDAQGWAAVQPPTLSLFPGAEEAATVTFSPPRSPQVPAGQMPFGVHVMSKEDAAGSVVEEGVLDIAPFSDVFAELAPRTSRGRGGASHDLAIDNRGNAPLNASLSAADPDRLLNFEVIPPGIVADPGTASFAKVAVKPRQRFWRGSARTRPFQVLVEQPGSGSITVDGTMVQEAILPSWFMRALLLLLGLLVAAAILWVFLIRPAIQATAEERAEEVLAAVGITPGPDPVPNPNPNPNPNPTPTPVPGSSQGPAPPVVVGLGELIDGRIDAGGAPLVGEPGKTLFITDLVFSNPVDTAVGDLSLDRAGERLLGLRLENFRDLDFHFVTPIAVLAGQQVSLTCGGCTASLYYSGYQR